MYCRLCSVLCALWDYNDRRHMSSGWMQKKRYPNWCMLVICLDVSQNGFLFSSTSTFFASFVLRVHNSSSFLPYSPSYYLFFFCTCPSIYSVPHLMLLFSSSFNPLKPELNPICYLLALLGAHHFLYVSRIRVKLVTFRWLMSYIYGAPILDVSRSHTTTQHSR